MKIHFLLIYSLPGLRSLPKYFQNVAAFIINSGSDFHIHFFTVQRNLSFPNTFILRPLKLVSAMVRRCSAGGSLLEHNSIVGVDEN